jgi:hypothetical protein
MVRVKKYILGEEKTLGEEFLHREQKKILSAKNSSPRASRLALSEEILRREFLLLSAEKFLKNTFSPSIFFYHQHALIQRIC